jgi:hypothetical protein
MKLLEEGAETDDLAMTSNTFDQRHELLMLAGELVVDLLE